MNTILARKMLSILFISSLAGGLLSGFVLPAAGRNTLPDGNRVVVNQTDATPTPTEEPPTRYFMQFDEVSFYYISSVASKVTGRMVEKNLDVNNPINPKMDQFEFQNYAALSQLKPRISVFSAQDFMDFGGDSAIKQVEKLKLLNASQQTNPQGDLPMLMGEPFTQLLHGGLQYLRFQNGAGVRYLTQYGEQPWPLDNSRLFYTFQGLTDDGAWYVSAVLPVNHAPLEGDDGLARMQEDYTKFQTNYPAYVDYVQKQLNAELPNTFAPNLASLDAMIKSMTIEKKAPVPLASPTGKPTIKPTITVTNSPAGCTNEAAFIADITIPDNTVLEPGATFKKTWRLKNIGTCTWTTDYKLIFVDGTAMGAPAAVKLTAGSVPPNATQDVSIILTAPDEPGVYQAFFKMRAPGGAVFGIQPNGSNAFWVLINVVNPETAEEPGVTLVPIIPKLTLIVPPKLIPVQP